MMLPDFNILPIANPKSGTILMTSLPFKMLFQAYDPDVDSFASMNEHCGKNLALNIS